MMQMKSCDADEELFLATSADTALVRYVSMKVPFRTQAAKIKAPLRILVVISNPTNLNQLNYEHEKWLIQEALAERIAQGQVQVQILEHAIINKINHAIRSFFPHVFHFVGHGLFQNDTSYIVLEDEDEAAYAVDGQTFRNFFTNCLPLLTIEVIEPADGGDTLHIQKFVIEPTIDGDTVLYQPKDSARAVYFDNDRVVDVGLPLRNSSIIELHARGITGGQRLCAIDLQQSVKICDTIDAPTKMLKPVSIPDWKPEVITTQLEDGSIQIDVQNIDVNRPNELHARIYPEDSSASEVIRMAYGPQSNPDNCGIQSPTSSFNGIFSSELQGLGSTVAGHVHIWVDEEEPRREAIVAYSWRSGAQGSISGSGGGYAPIPF